MNQNFFINQEADLADSLTAHSVGRIWGTPQQLRWTYPYREAIRVKVLCGLLCSNLQLMKIDLTFSELVTSVSWWTSFCSPWRLVHDTDWL